MAWVAPSVRPVTGLSVISAREATLKMGTNASAGGGGEGGEGGGVGGGKGEGGRGGGEGGGEHA